jgi:hypothetical protein
MHRVGHLELGKRVCAYLLRFRNAKIRFRTGVLDHTDVASTDLDEWSRSVFGDVKEEIPTNAPRPHGKPVTSPITSMQTSTMTY